MFYDAMVTDGVSGTRALKMYTACPQSEIHPFTAPFHRTCQADHIALVHQTLDPIVTLAEQANCTLVIENIYDKNSAPLLALIRSFESEHVWLSIDIGYADIKQLDGGPTPDQ